MTPELLTRSNNACELCESDSGLAVFTAEGDTDHPKEVVVCDTCLGELSKGTDEPLDEKHWFCLQGAIWSQVPAVQVTAYRLLHRLETPSLRDLIAQVYLEEDVLAWATADADGEAREPTFDSNGAQLHDGDSVTLIKDLDVKGTSFVAKRGTMVKNIRLTDNPNHVEGKVNKIGIVLKTEFLKKA